MEIEQFICECNDTLIYVIKKQKFLPIHLKYCKRKCLQQLHF